ncbi:MAG: FG-GAP repeat protein [Spirochaetales bacterium]|nr:FG-GAP repeat protein [Spirochaetales bacterium]
MATKLSAAGGTAGDAFGCAVCISGNYAVIGAAQDNPKGSFSGSAFVFHLEETTTMGIVRVPFICSNNSADFRYRFGEFSPGGIHTSSLKAARYC